MLIRLGFDIQFEVPSPVAMIALYHVHPSRRADFREPDEQRVTPTVPTHEYEDSFGNLTFCGIYSPRGITKLTASWTPLGTSSATPNRDGRASKPYAIGCSQMLHSATRSRVRR